MTLSDKQLDELLRLEEKATLGPWLHRLLGPHRQVISVGKPGTAVFYRNDAAEGNTAERQRQAPADFDFTAASRNALRPLVEEVKQLREHFAECERVLQIAEKRGPGAVRAGGAAAVEHGLAAPASAPAGAHVRSRNGRELLSVRGENFVAPRARGLGRGRPMGKVVKAIGRVNIEGDLETHPEFWNVVQVALPKVGGDVHLARAVAKGWLVDLFRLARKRFEEPENFPLVTGLISAEDLRGERLEFMVDAGWVVPEGAGFQVKNAAKHFAWLIASKENGKKGGRPPKPPEPPEAPEPEPEETHGLPPGTQAAAKPNLPSTSTSTDPSKKSDDDDPKPPAAIIGVVDEVCDRLKFGPEFRAYWRKKAPPAWLADTLMLFETQAHSPGNSFAHRPLVARATDFLTKRLKRYEADEEKARLEREAEAKANAPPPPPPPKIPMREEFVTGPGGYQYMRLVPAESPPKPPQLRVLSPQDRACGKDGE